MIVLTGQWNRWIRLVYHVDVEQAARLLPEGLEPAGPDCCEIHIAELSGLRPAGLPEWCGMSGTLLLYCLRTSLSSTGEPWLYGLRIDAAPRILSAVGPLSDDFGFHPADIAIDSYGSKVRLSANDPTVSSTATLEWETPRLNSTVGSLICSSHLLSRRQQAGFLLAELPFVDQQPPLPLCVTIDRWPFFHQLGLRNARLKEATLRFPQFDCSWIFGHRIALFASSCGTVEKQVFA